MEAVFSPFAVSAEAETAVDAEPATTSDIAEAAIILALPMLVVALIGGALSSRFRIALVVLPPREAKGGVDQSKLVSTGIPAVSN